MINLGRGLWKESKMVQNHLSRLAAPRSWPVGRKGNKWITRTMPGPHSLYNSIPLSVLVKDMLRYSKTQKEVNFILNNGGVIIDKKIRKERGFPIGLMDVIEIPGLGEIYRLLYNKRGLFSLVSISKNESNLKLLKVIRKSIAKGEMFQITFHDGRNLLTKKFDGGVGDSVLFDLQNGGITKIVHLDKGSLIYLNGGAHIGMVARVKEIVRKRGLQKPRIVIEMDGKEYTTLVDYAFVVGSEKSELELEDKK